MKPLMEKKKKNLRSRDEVTNRSVTSLTTLTICDSEYLHFV